MHRPHILLILLLLTDIQVSIAQDDSRLVDRCLDAFIEFEYTDTTKAKMFVDSAIYCARKP